jgi:hypothetical protein
MTRRTCLKVPVTLAALIGVSMGLPAAAYMACTGPITLLALSLQSGVVTTAIASYGPWALCNVSSASNGVTTDACKALYAQLTMAVASNRRVQFDFNDGTSAWTHDTSWCTSIGAWVVPNPYPYMVQLVDY